MPASTKKRVINANILLYGPKASGKSSNLRYIQKKLKPEQRGEIEIRRQEGSPAIEYEYLPIKLGELMGYETNLFIYTVPDGEAALETRLALLPSAAGVAFIGHSSATRMADNIASLEALKDELRYFDLDYETFPLLFQYNHRDATDLIPIDVLERRLNPEGKPIFEAIASSGDGVRSTFAAISKMAVRRVRLQLISEEGGTAADLDAMEGLQPVRAPSPEVAKPAAPVQDLPKVVAVAPAIPVVAPVVVAPPVEPEPIKVAPQAPTTPESDEEASPVAGEVGGRKKKGKQHRGARAEAPPAPAPVRQVVEDETPYDGESSGEFPRPAGENFLTTRLAASLNDGQSEVMEVMETLGAEDDDDDREITNSGAARLLGSRQDEPVRPILVSDYEDRGALTLSDLHLRGPFPTAAMGGGDSGMNIVTVDEDEEDEDIRLLGQAGAFSDAALMEEEEEFDVDELDDLGLDEAASEELQPEGMELDSPADEAVEPEEEPLPPTDPLDDDDESESERSIIASPDQISAATASLAQFDTPSLPEPLTAPPTFDDRSGSDGFSLNVSVEDTADEVDTPSMSDVHIEGVSLYEGPGGAGEVEDVFPPAESLHDAGTFEDEVTADVPPQLFEMLHSPSATPESVEPRDLDNWASTEVMETVEAEVTSSIPLDGASITHWGDVVRVDHKTLQLPVTVLLADTSQQVELVVTLHVEQLLPALAGKV